MLLKSVIKKTILAALIITILSSCSRKLGYGYLLWSPDEEQISTGSKLVILSESKINDTYIVQLEDQKEKIEIPKWRVLLFEKEPELESAFNEYSLWIPFFAENLKQSLPIRSEPDSHQNNTIYKLREGQQIKIIYRQNDPVNIANLEGYWYEVLTDDGVRGWVFDYFLQVYQIGADQSIEIQNDRVEEDPLLSQIYDKSFYPRIYEEMINRQTIDLGAMKEDYHFIINRTDKTVSIRTREHFLEEHYDEAVQTAYHKYNFIGTSFSLEANSSNLISLQYNYEGTEIKMGMVRLSKPLQEILEEETFRRQALAEEFISNGPKYSSDTYGKIEFLENQRFFWKEKSILISQNLLSSEAGNQGQYSFSKFLDNGLRSKYDGVICLKFNNGESLDFLYKHRSTGFLMLYVSPSYFEKNIIESDRVLNPMQIFFHKIEEEAIEE